ncbi:VOC family protein [Vibrio sp. SCSIO 43132]|uniref:VOC family protein n=1 Tax=Vibrio sp. SCSIO 43132 TaxID=2779363 RepID=UPI001CA889E9|nr:VOC family protein [Vibrio sp. SCSIO 43132]UAB71467.1 VOC family protein [Vibrio sp. SCSIO 43132]
MKILMMRIPCKNLKEAEAFYSEKLGWQKIFGSEPEGYIGYQLDNVQVLLEPEEIGEFECGRYLGFSLEVEDINHYYEETKKKGVTFIGSPEKQDWGGIMTHIEDCSKNSFSIVQSDE